ncbi:MAG: phosphoadenosine phosphosulfate reductase family protein [Lachnospiraceae bacterium]|nr:phosphoadenosine phosphosulfate reductase family protein [Lachnospiraceae bacterium]
MNLDDILDQAPQNSLIGNSLIITYDKIRKYDKILCSVSGGSDSDILVDLCQKYDDIDKITYAFFDTGLEFAATKEHLDYLEQRYGITIQRIRANKSVPLCCKTYGQPFISKQVSEWIERLQKHNFQWEDEPLDILEERYPNCRAALRWWCNDFASKSGGEESSFNIAYNQYLKEFLVEYPPQFHISNKCCHYAKKLVAKKYKENGGFDLNIYGVRKSEGGVRRSAYKTCFSSNDEECDEYRPIFWYLADTKNLYYKHYNIQNSRCYCEYGLKRTGCAGCPFARNFEEELEAMRRFEPKLYVAVNNIFADSYAYTRKYRDFIRKKRNNNNEGDE